VAPEDQAPFRKGINDEATKKPKYPAFHDDNIIDPELADYMSDESSGDEQMSIFASMSTADLHSTSFENERATFHSSMNSGKKYRHRAGEKSISGMSYHSRGGQDDISSLNFAGHRRPTRRRNLSNVSGNMHHLPSPRPKSAVFKGPSASSEMLFALEHPNISGTHLPRNESFRHLNSPKVELNKSSLRHVDKLLHQLLNDAKIPNPLPWQQSLVPILLQATDDVDPDVAKGDDMDIRHYVKLKRIPGGKPADTSYISGVVFTKNLALKSMPRRITNPRIVLVTFPVEYQRHQQQFMSLQPVIEQEKEFLRVVVQRITNLRPHLLLAEKSVSGVALQYLSEANISVAYNVKHTVIEAVARCAEVEIISSLDMLALPVKVRKCTGFEVRTFVNNDHPGRKKSYIFLSGCRPDLGCTITLRGANHAVLGKIKHIVEFMVYVVYNLKLESSLLKDESIEPPDATETTSLSNSLQGLHESIGSVSTTSANDGFNNGPTVVVNHASSESEPPSQVTAESSSLGGNEEDDSLHKSDKNGLEEPADSITNSQPHAPTENQVPDDIPMPTYYSDMVAKYETKILSASPYVKFTQPYLLMRAREQERRLMYLRRLLDHDAIEQQEGGESTDTKQFQLIKPEMVEQLGQKAPKDMMEIIRAVHDAEYDKARYNYQTQTRQWETYIQGNLDLFDPYSHQNIVVLYSMICTDTKIPCTEPVLVAINFYDEQHFDTEMDPDRTLGQYIEDLVFDRDDVCNSNGCERTMLEHHRTYVHDEARVTVFVEHVPNAPERKPDLGDGITMWTYCKICKKDSQETEMSEATYKYSFGKYLELLYWGQGLKMKDVVDCPHDHHRDHVRYFSLEDCRVRMHWDPIDLLEIVVPRARITWKVANDLKLKNEIYTKLEERWGKFMASVKARLKGISIDSVLPEKAESCKAELDKLSKRAREDQPAIVKRLQDIYVNSKYYEVVPFNSIVREMLEKAGEWDTAFAKFEADFLDDKDMRQLTMMQLKKMFADNESKESLVSTEGSGSVTDGEDRPSQTFSETEDKSTQPTDYTDNTSMDASATSSARNSDEKAVEDERVTIPVDGAIERVEPLDLATSPTAVQKPILPLSTEVSSQAPSSPEKSMQEISVSPRGRSIPVGSAIPRRSIDQGRGELASKTSTNSVTSTNPDTTKAVPDRRSSRSSITNTSPPISRAISQPPRPLPRSQSSSGKALALKEGKKNQVEQHNAGQPSTDGSIKVDKKLSDRLGLNALKNRGKTNASGIPRLVPRKESKVSTLARHFEILSREFENQRKRDRKNRAASTSQPRAMLPRTSTKAIVQVYDDVNEAFEEPVSAPEPASQHEVHPKSAERSIKPEDEAIPKHVESEPPSQTEPASQNSEMSTEKESGYTSNADIAQTASDEEGAGSDTEPTASEEYLPDIKEIADSLEPSTEIPLELPKHQKTSLMKYLTKFWAERSASGWAPLEYPVAATDHIFVDSDIIVREGEPSSVIALALNSDDYQGKLAQIRLDAQANMQREIGSGQDTGPDTDSGLPTSEGGADWLADETELEKSLLRATGTHITYQFKERAASMTCTIFYAEQFDALRRKCGVAERIVESLSRCLKWDSKGGKTKSVFLKTLDDRLILKVS
jgi:1-phosphatidylinositol-3-phosphate 5-kinase